MIHCTVCDHSDNEIYQFWARFVPRKGEVLWRANEGARSSLVVTDVCHWVVAKDLGQLLGSVWAPDKHSGEARHHVCLYVKPVQHSRRATKAKNLGPFVTSRGSQDG